MEGDIVPGESVPIPAGQLLLVKLPDVDVPQVRVLVKGIFLSATPEV